ncbi:MAG TPA: MdtA/MuxA family multidrug efflux RND transporter periplasmic adaptor subunit [Thermoanaerobaculia bacterium]
MATDATITEPEPPRAKKDPANPAPRRGEPAALPPEEPDTPAPKRRRWPWVVAAAAVVLAIVLFRTGSSRKQAAQDKKAQAQIANRQIPVTGAAARVGDLDVYLTGLGTVSAVNTVTVRSRVDGQLIRIAFREGQLVRQGDLLAEIDPRPFQVQLTQAEGQMARDQAALQNALVDLQRYQVLASQDAIPKQQLDTQNAAVRQFQAAVKTDQGQIESAKLNLTYSRVTAPIAGSVGLKLVDAGNIVHANDPNGIVVITQLQPINVVFTIPADQLPPVRARMQSVRKLPVEAWDRELKNRLAVGSLLAVDNQIDQTTGTVRIKAEFQNENGALYSNQFVNARLLVNTLHGVVIVPSAALQRSPQSVFVYVVKPDSTVEMRNVTVALTQGDDTVMKQGVAAGEVVVIDGVDKLQQGSKVALNMAGAGAPGGPPGRTGAGGRGAGNGPPAPAGNPGNLPAPRGR